MATYSIKQLSLLVGIKAHTIRIWEKRYNMFSPSRTQTNIRRYSDDDLRLALNVKHLQNMGYKISHIAKMSEKEVVRMVESGNEFVSPPPAPESLLLAAINLDEKQLVAKINESIHEKGFEWTMENMVFPFQVRMGLLWQSGAVSPAQEHFSSNTIRDIIISNTNSISNLLDENRKMLFFLPEGELHEIALLYFNYIARKEGVYTYYLGQSVPLGNVREIALSKKISLLFTSVTIPLEEEMLHVYFEKIVSLNPQIRLFATGYQSDTLKSIYPSKITTLASSHEFRDILSKQF